MAYRDVVLVDTPIDFYEMETSTGTDSGSGGRTLTLSGGVTTDVAGIIGDAWSFDGTNDYASMATWPSLTTAFTFEAWVKPNVAGVNDTPTVIRRDGTDIHLLRVRGSAIASNPGQAEVFADGLTLVSTSSYRVDDGNWHHIVYTQSGNAAKLYVDGQQRASGTTTQSTFNMGTGTGYIGAANGATEFYKGAMDNVAVYNTALSAARVLAHYNAAFVNGGYTAQAMTANATAPDAVVTSNVRRVLVTDDTYSDSINPTVNYGAGATLSLANSRPVFIKLPSAGLTGTEAISTALLRLTTTAGGSASAGSLNVYRITSDWDESTLTHNVQPSKTLVRTDTFSGTTLGNTEVTVDVATVLATTNYGVALQWTTTGGPTFVSSEGTGTKPLAEYLVVEAVSISPTASVMTAAATMPNASVATAANAQYGAQAMAASASMPNAVASVEQFIDVALDAEPMDALATWPTATGFSLNVNQTAQPFGASALTVDAAVAVQRGPRVFATPMAATAVWKQPSAINGTPITASEIDDKYFQRIWSAVPARWYRLNDTGSIAVDRMAPTGAKGYYEGVQTGQFNAPDGRHSVYFDGTARIRQDEPVTAESGGANSTLEFSFRSNKQNQFLMVTADTRAGINSNTLLPIRELFMSGGRLGYREYALGSNTPTEFLGFRNLADGEWHTVVIRSTDTPQVINNFDDGVEIYIDGKFELRRRAATQWTGFPDYIGGRPAAITSGPIGNQERRTMPDLPSSQNFVGDMSEVVFFNDVLSAHEITRHFYDFMGWTPIEAEPMEAFAFTPADTFGRGNQKRALYLWWDSEQDYYQVAGGGAGLHDTMNFDPVLGGHGNTGVYDLEGYKVFSRSVTLQPNNTPYMDTIYDLPSLINLTADVELKDYDVIMFGDWPDEGYEEDRLRAYYPKFTADKERLISQLRDANEKGVGLLVTHPRLAVDLGIVDRVEYVPTLKESKGNGLQGNAGGLYDYGSAVKFPWDITSDAHLADGPAGAIGTGVAMTTDPAYLAGKAFYYEDMNFNNKFRVRATVEGLTDIPAYIVKDAVFHIDYDAYGDYLHALDLVDKRNGLLIGDEFIFHGTNVASLDWQQGQWDGLRAGRPYGYFATPLANVKSGTVVTTFGATHYKDTSLVDNPYKDYATTIVLDRGDVLAGRAVGGRIFVNFTEQPNRFNSSFRVDIIPGSPWDDGTAVWPNTYTPDTIAQRNWEYSNTRMVAGNTAINGRLVETTVTMPDGSTFVARSAGAGGLVSADYTKLFGTAYVPRWDMTRRGMWWVGRGERAVEGEKRVAATPMTATAAIVQPVVTAQRDAGYVAEPMRALAQMTRVAESTVGDVQVVTLPWTASATWTGFSRVVSAAPMEATAEFVENFDMVHATGEQVVLTLHGVDATLYLKEETL